MFVKYDNLTGPDLHAQRLRQSEIKSRRQGGKLPDSVMMGIYWHLKRQWQNISLIASLHWSALCATKLQGI